MDMEKVIKGLQEIVDDNWMKTHADWYVSVCSDALALLKEDCHNCKLECLLQKYDELKEKYDALLKEREGLLGIQQTADSITFVSTGTAQQGEARGLLLGKLAMHEWLKKELLYRGLLTDDIRAVFDEAKRQEGR